MRAVQFDHHGDVDVLEVRGVPDPQPGAGEVLVEVRAAGTNPGEIAIRSGAMEQMFPTTFPSGQGSDLAGVVRSVGEGVSGFAAGDEGVSGFAAGDEVLGWSEQRSSQAELVAVPAGQLVAKPAGLPWEVAGSLYVVGCTAYAAARAVSAARGDTVAVSAAAGGVGTVLTQLLRSRGVEVLGIAGESNADWLRSVGATPVTYGDGLADRLTAAAPGGIDAFIDLFGPDYVQLAVDLGIPKDRIDTIISFELAGKLGVKAEGSSEASTPEVLGEVAGLVADGSIEVPIAGTYPLERVRDAYTELADRHTHGKIVLIP